uniref:Uncharacterized protein n=1 Tax=Chlorobium phaeobacteroides (strain BS1) TaxID=331678 RepID=B3EJJ4_CHLPB
MHEVYSSSILFFFLPPVLDALLPGLPVSVGYEAIFCYLGKQNIYTI